jgi:hypothetical protein
MGVVRLRNDPAESHDLAKDNPAKRDELLKLWDQYVSDNGVILTGDGMFKTRGSVAAEEDD